TGIETSSYGEDFEEDEPLLNLVEEISVERLRFGSLHPSFFTEERVKRLSKVKGVMPHFHLSVQSASSKVLENMKRGYDEEALYNAVTLIRKYFPIANLSADMICGFPGESESDFLKSVEFIRNAEILHTHVFPYSRREGTRAASMKEVPDFEKHERAREMTRVAEEVHRKVFEKNIGKEYTVLTEFFRGDKAFGYTENFINLAFQKPENIKKGDLIKIKITPCMDKSLQNDKE
ncbi:MAG: radical SAM protein, partial [Clostridia bacterium]|nr:radical SAM protein [Clostridia bacterium]